MTSAATSEAPTTREEPSCRASEIGLSAEANPAPSTACGETPGRCAGSLSLRTSCTYSGEWTSSSSAVIAAIAKAAGKAHLLDSDPDPDHNRVVVSIAGGAGAITEGLLGAIAEAVKRIDLRRHHGVHPRVGAADVVPVIPLGGTTLDESRALAHDVGRRVWSELKVPVYFYGH